METNDCGLIYGLTNPYFEGMVKIGATRRLDINRRIHELGTAVPAPFACAFAYKVPHASLFEIEHTLHENYADKRIDGTEFFRVDPAKVDKLMHALGKFEPMQAAVQEAIDMDEAKRRLPNMDFFKMGLTTGQVLVYTKDPSVKCQVATNRKVAYNGHESSLSSLTQQLLGYAAQPSPYWLTEDGVSLVKLYIQSLQKEAAEVAALQDAVDNKCNSLL